MKRHPFNVVSFGFGVVLILLAVKLVVPYEFSGIGTFQWLLPVALVLVGVSMLGSLFRRRATDPDPFGAMDGALDGEKPEDATDSAAA